MKKRIAAWALAWLGSTMAFAQTYSLENPQPGSYQSGLGVFSGWSCSNNVQLIVDGVTYPAAAGTPRSNFPTNLCNGNSNVNFALLRNFNNFGPGEHTVQLFVNGSNAGSPVKFNVTVPIPAAPFATGLSKTVLVSDFPSTGHTTNLVWQESAQNFAIAGVDGIQANNVPQRPAPSSATYSFENPQPASYQSGLGVFSGWSCSSDVQIIVDGVTYRAAAGTPRSNFPLSLCGGNANVNFALLRNFNNFGTGQHTAQLVIDGVNAGAPVMFNVTVPNPAAPFATGLAKTVTVADFPQAGQATSMLWQEAAQNFAIARVSASLSCVAPQVLSQDGQYCVTPSSAWPPPTIYPMGVKVVGANQLPPGCNSWYIDPNNNKSAEAPCWKDAVMNGTVKFIATSAKMTGLSGGRDVLPIVFPFIRNNSIVQGVIGLWDYAPIYANNGMLVGSDISWGVTEEIDWVYGTNNGLITHARVSNLCYEFTWKASIQVWSNSIIACP